MKDVETGIVYSCADQPGYIPIVDGLRLLRDAEVIIFHNGIKFDIPVIKKLYPFFKPKGVIRDTLVISRLIYTNLVERDQQFIRKHPEFPLKLIGRHSLESWGWRLGNYKGDFKGPWDTWTQEMQDYCEQDVEVTAALWKLMCDKGYSEEAIQLEHEVAEVIFRQEQAGFAFDVEAAQELYAELVGKRIELTHKAQQVFKPWYVNKGEFTPKKDNAKAGYTGNATLCRVHLQHFNPGSRDQIADRLSKLRQWKPKVFTDGGKPQVDETVLGALPYPEAKVLSEYMLIEKRIGQLAEGANAWLKLERKGRIHGTVLTNGAVTGRATHNSPNIAQVPKASDKVPYGKQCRALFGATQGRVLVGADLSGLELRCLAHYMARWDGGAYGKVLLEGDIHAANQEAAGLPTRDNAKTFISMG